MLHAVGSSCGVEKSHVPSSSQELFKSFARYLSHLLAEGRSQGTAQGGFQKSNTFKSVSSSEVKILSHSLFLPQSKPRPRPSSRSSSARCSTVAARPTGRASKRQASGRHKRARSDGGRRSQNSSYSTLPQCQCLIRLFLRPPAALSTDARRPGG